MSASQTSPMHNLASAPLRKRLGGIIERREHGLTVLSAGGVRDGRRVLFVNSYGGVDVWEKVKAGSLPPHHMWGCLELLEFGYEVALAEPVRHFDYWHPLPHDWPILRSARSWLRPDDILYCGHTLLFWLPLVRALGGLRAHLVSLTYAREELDFARAHSGIIAMTPAAAHQARKMSAKSKVAHIPWGCDPDFFPRLDYDPQWFLSCGITQRDFVTLSVAAGKSDSAIRLICPGIKSALSWPSNVELIDGGPGWNHQKTLVSYHELFHDHYSKAIASLIILKNDPTEYTAVGFTSLLEAMALERPVIVTRTGAIPGELDVERAGCGLHVPPDDPQALAAAIASIANNPDRAQAMGKKGRELVDSHYNISRYARELHAFFESL